MIAARVWYLDASVLLRWLLGHPQAFAVWSDPKERVASSRLIAVEGRRVLDRYRQLGILNDAKVAELSQKMAVTLTTLEEVPLDDAILARAAEPLPVIVGTLDSIHLVTALAYREQASIHVIFATHDAQLAKAARLMGFEVQP